MVDLKLQANVTQTVELLLSPRLLQMLKVLSLPYLEIVEQITKESEENVMLEVERKDEYVEFLRYLTSDRKIKKEADFSELAGLENIGRVEKTLEEHLLQQLELEDLEEDYKNIAREIILNIDDHGYLLSYPQLRQKIMQRFDVSRPTVDKILKLVQNFEPEGVGARNLKECLLIQIKAYNFENESLEEILEKVVKNYLEDLEAQNFSKIAAGLGVAESGVREIAAFIKNNLNPYPGSSFGGGSRQVIPSFAVEKNEEGYKLINLETRYGPAIKISPLYLKMLENPSTDEKTKTFLKERLKRAKALMEDFSKRGETLEKIARKIIGFQTDFLERGLIWLKPLSQKSLAEEFDLHPSTISRAVAEKFLQTPQGLFPLKFLCPRGPKGMTAARLKALIVEIIGGEDKTTPLTDERITELMKEKGADINRRTVAFYRKGLKISTAMDRMLEEEIKND
jgi:RNA polymerase sigma-54 factor